MEFRALSKSFFIIFMLLSFVSLFADMTYEGARSIFGSYVELLGATALFASLASIGEFLSYIVRLLSGAIAGYWRSSKVYWSLIFTGYLLNLVACPLLALSGYWQIAILLILLERIGKGLRTPVRDVVIAEVTEKIGRGKAFGLHETLDQAGAVLGPLMVSIILYTTNNSYTLAFISLTFPAIVSIALLLSAYSKYPRIKSAETSISTIKSKVVLSKAFWLYTISLSLVSLGFIHWVNISYYLRTEGFPDYLIATMYVVAMLIDGLLAFPIGVLYDRVGLVSLLIAPILSALVVPMLITNVFALIIVSSVFWGAVMGIYESITRAAIADIVPMEGRAYAYGVFGAFFGVSWMVGSMVYGYLYQHSLITLMVIFSIVTESLAFICLIMSIRVWRK